ncbi:MAG: hypothetical protein E6G51_10990 [Actinobacteria bacterium]|nr:MAG: hypothetical protein E6G51_10990 [Actinomycetota bacterium]
MSPGPERSAEQGGSGHPRTVTALLLIGTLLAFLAIFSIWVNRQALNTDNWVDTSGSLLQDEEVRAQLSNYLADQLVANVDVQGELESRFPPRLAPLAAPAAGALEQLAPQAAERALETSQVESLWNTANRTAHERLLAVLNDSGSSNLSTANGEVVLDLSALLTQLTDRLGVGGKLVEKLPPDAGQLTILKSDELSTAQDATTVVRHLPVVLTLLALLLYAAAVYLAGPRRREALRSVGLGFLLAGVLALVLRKFAGVEVTGALSGSDSVEPAVAAVWDIGTSLLVSVAVSAITFGILIVLAAWLAGPTRAATRLRREAAPHLRERGTTYGAVALAFLALVLWAPVVAFQKPIGMVLLAVLMVLGTEALRRQTAAEFPAG